MIVAKGSLPIPEEVEGIRDMLGIVAAVVAVAAASQQVVLSLSLSAMTSPDGLI